VQIRKSKLGIARIRVYFKCYLG